MSVARQIKPKPSKLEQQKALLGGASYEDHEAATLFPLMSDDRFAELVESIRANGLIHEIVIHDGKILDGRNRYRACVEAGVEPRFRDFVGDPFTYAWSANGQRRDLVLEQRAVIFVMATKKSEEWKTRQAEIAAEANRKRSEKTKAQHAVSNPRAGETKSGVPTTCGTTKPASAEPKDKNTSATEKAAASGTNRGAIERAERLVKADPALAAKVAAGEVKPTAAHRQLKKAEVEQKVKELPDGKFRVIYADPPWAYNDTREGLGAGDGQTVDRASTAAKNHYPTMTMAELKELDVKSLAADDSVLFCWATFPLLPEQLEVVKAWGFKYKTAFVWDKDRGTFGHYHTAEAELLLVCTRGSCTPDADKREAQVQRHPRGEHSRKPDAIREMIDRLYPHGPRVELFRRGEAPDGWVIWGAEAEEAEAA
ncbi:MAG: MT-A70 family methyltransferase [Aquamicrobium sp.]|uniref:MT-A70 family methyltransferase n=1 Tax=Aquamicrobium sp. TaxID=1872579 RepID=UPI00349EBC70|nr:MT-A70 family methyltransferase [Aquamicrobium sp.]